MKGIVVDASIALNWLLEEEQNESSRWALEQMEAGIPTFVPSLWLLEITNVLFSAERRKRIDRRHRDQALAQIERLPLVILPGPTLPEWTALRALAEKHQLTAYDAEYLRVAKQQKLVLVTLDRNLRIAASREKVDGPS